MSAAIRPRCGHAGPGLAQSAPRPAEWRRFAWPARAPPPAPRPPGPRGRPGRWPAPREPAPAPGQDQIQRPAVADQTRQAHRAAVDQRHAKAPAIDAEAGVGGQHAQVAPQGQFQPAGHRRALDGSNHRLGQAQPRGSHRCQRLGCIRRLVELQQQPRHVARRVLRQLGTGLQIPAGAKMPVRAVPHGHTRRGVAIEVDKSLVQGPRRVGVNGVAPRWTVQGHARDMAVFFPR